VQRDVAQGFTTFLISVVAGIGFILVVNLICFLLVKKKASQTPDKAEESFEVEVDTKL
jgi:ABC-type transport system involved in multi-copper enzyme maturation permease subunit